MTQIFPLVIFLYLASTAAYLAYLFKQKEPLERKGFYLLLSGFVCHTASIVLSWVQEGHIPAYNMHGNLVIAGWAVAGVFLLFRYRLKLKILGVYAAPLAAMIVLSAALLPNEPNQEVTANLFSSLWLVLHVICIFIGEAAFALACGAGVLYLVQENAIKTKSNRFFFKRLPSLELLDSTGYACIVTGFTMLTAGLITGIVYAETTWGRFWSWDPKEVWSAISWLLYAALIHGRLTAGWRGRRAAYMAIIGFIVLLFTFFGVNFFMEGHHGEFTRW